MTDPWQGLEEDLHQQWVEEYERNEKGNAMRVRATSSKNSDFVQAKPGTYGAYSIKIIDLGDEFSEKYNKMQHKVMIEFEIPDQTIEIDGYAKPLTISNWYTLSLAPMAALRRDLESWRGKPFTEKELSPDEDDPDSGFELKNVVGKPCMLTIIQADNGKSYVRSVSKLPKGMEMPAQFNSNVYFSMAPEEWTEDMEQVCEEKIGEGLKKRIKASPQWAALHSEKQPEPDPIASIKDDIPF